MIDLKNYIKEGIFDEEDQLEDIDRNAEGINIALKEMKQYNKYFNRDVFNAIIKNLTPYNKFGRLYRESIKESLEQAEAIFIRTCSNIFANKCNNALKFLNRILYKHLDDIFEYVPTGHITGFGPMLRKSPLHKFDKEDLDKRQFSNYDDAYALLAWAEFTSPRENYMIKIPKDLDKYETEFMVELIKLLYKNR